MHSYYAEIQKKLDQDELNKNNYSSSSEEEEEGDNPKKERIRDLEGGESNVEEDSSSDIEDDKQDLDMRLKELEKFVSRMTEEEQEETMYLFNEDVSSYEEEAERLQQRLEQVRSSNELLLQKLNELKTNPDSYQGNTDDPLDWIDTPQDTAAATAAAAATTTTDSNSLINTISNITNRDDRPADASSSDTSSDRDPFSIEDGEEEAQDGAPYRIIGANAGDWMED
ncbi:hypothetical protein EMWEY_00015820 [Eimeria maxima]|uniref:Uncharacterized protein n=1 Tax=Eimeria maxima TaxID=5804 RepID=U6M2I7_EIMMA|nr:hypothetical protein EMWEY_00015820 [Eimeria maxima]CDJ58447.1 hypothetical protein EMWEY_00015820 [Eimeria maxima]